MVREIEIRECRIHDILTASAFVNFACPLGMGPLTTSQQANLYGLLKKALYQCNVIADIAVNSQCRPIPESSYGRINSGHFKDALLAPMLREQDPVTHPLVRPYQREYINQLSLEDVAVLFYLTKLFSLGYVQYYQGYVPQRFDAFEDCVLQHGTWFLWCFAASKPLWKVMGESIVDIGMVGLRNYRDDEGNTVPSLKRALVDRFKHLANCGTNAVGKIRLVVQHLVQETDGYKNGEWQGEIDVGTGDEEI